MSLKERAEQLARGDQPTADAPAPAPVPSVEPGLDVVDPEDLIPAPPEGGPDQVPVHIAWSRVMATVGAVDKQESGTGITYLFRGVDTALNTFGPACRLHGVLVIPVRVEASYRDTKTSRGNAIRECTVVVTYRVYGPGGDYFEGQAAGESLDTSDKGSAKAQAVALRTFLFHGALVPTRDQDPDSVQVERGDAAVRSAASYRDEALDPGTTLARLRQIHHELREHRLVAALVTNETGEDEPLGQLVGRIGTERRAAENHS